MQGQTEGELGEGQSRRPLNGKPAKYSCQRTKRCNALEPVLEHCELAVHGGPACDTSLQRQHGGCSSSSKGKSLRVLSRLRDSYVRMMNDVASGADLAGMSSYYGAGFGSSSSGDYAPVSPNARSVTKEPEKDHRFTSPPSACA